MDENQGTGMPPVPPQTAYGAKGPAGAGTPQTMPPTGATPPPTMPLTTGAAAPGTMRPTTPPSGKSGWGRTAIVAIIAGLAGALIILLLLPALFGVNPYDLVRGKVGREMHEEVSLPKPVSYTHLTLPTIYSV